MNILCHDNPPSARTAEADEAVFTAARETADPALPPETSASAGTLGWRRHVSENVYPGVSRDCAGHVPAGGAAV